MQAVWRNFFLRLNFKKNLSHASLLGDAEEQKGQHLWHLSDGKSTSWPFLFLNFIKAGSGEYSVKA